MVIDVPSDRIYRFYSESDDGSKLYIHDELIVDNDFTHGMREKFGDVALTKGKHPITLTFFQGEGENGLKVSFYGPGIEKTVIPGEALYRVKN
ncbi:MAG: PA14 domain-containing protein [Ignavibacteriaceae bacterium]